MYENPQTVVLPEKTKMDNIISATLYLLSTGTWKANAFPYADIVQKASTPLDIIYLSQSTVPQGIPFHTDKKPVVFPSKNA